MSKVYGGGVSEDVQMLLHWWRSFHKQNPTCFHKRLHCNSYANYYNLTLIAKQVYAYLHCCLWVRDYYNSCLMAFTIICFFSPPFAHSDCYTDHKRTVRRPGWCRSASSSWQWDFSLCSWWVWTLVLWIPSTSPLQRPLRSYLSFAGLSAVFAVRNSCPVHLNSLDSVWVFVSVCEIVVSECLDTCRRMHKHNKIYQLCTVC